MEWVSSLGGQVQPKTIKAYLSHVRSLHIDNDLPFTPTESPIVQRLIRGIKRYHGQKDRKPKLPITLPILLVILHHINDAHSLDHQMLTAACCLAFAAFLRCGEFTVGNTEKWNPAINVSRSAITFLPNFDDATHMQLTLPASKTDPFRKGISILVGAAPSRASCPLTAIKAMFTSHPAPPDAPLFLTHTGKPLTRTFLIESIRSALRSGGFEERLYAGQSFRRGGASSAGAAGFSDYEIQLLGRWRSDAYKLYIDVPTPRILQMSSLLHWVQPSATAFVPPALHVASTMA